MAETPKPLGIGARISRMWNSGIVGKITILAAAGILSCCCLSIPLSLSRNNRPAPAAPPQTETNIVVVSTFTPEPSATLGPTDTPLPTETATPLPDPIILSGSGDNVLDIAKWEGPAILKITHNGDGNFAVWNDDANGDHIDLIVNTIGSYQGTHALDFLDIEHTSRFEITAGGAWELQVLPFDSVRRENIPGIFQGTGSDVIAFNPTDASPDLLKADASGADRNFAIWTYGNGRDLVINEIAPYTGIVPIDDQTFVLVITATGPWSIEITAR